MKPLTKNLHERGLNYFASPSTLSQSPPKSPTGASLTSKIRNATRKYLEETDTYDLLTDLVPTPSPHNEQTEVRKKGRKADFNRIVSKKLDDLDIRGALRILSSENGLADFNDESFVLLQGKHPAAPQDIDIPDAPEPTYASHSEAEVIQALASFPPGTSGAIDGIRPAHLRDLVGPKVGEAGAMFRRALTRLVNVIIRGETPIFISNALFGASLCALKKGTSDVRPIAVGLTYRRLAVKVALRPLTDILGEQLAPVQLGFGSRGGCEAAVHSARTFLTNLQSGEVIVKLDMRNAFNSLRRDHFLRVVRDRAPSLYAILHRAYQSPTPLFFGDFELRSATGIQQGDPAGPAVFSLAVDQIARSASSPLNLWYLDDATLGGPLEVVCRDIAEIVPRLSEIGLDLNQAKCEVICAPGTELGPLNAILSEYRLLSPQQTTLLGAPLSKEASSLVAKEKLEDLSRTIQRLREVEPHAAFFLLKNCLWLPKLLYLIRASPAYSDSCDTLQRMDSTLREALSATVNVNFREESWAQAVLPVRHGGLGLRSVSAVALPAYLASIHSSSGLVKKILPSHLYPKFVNSATTALNFWSTSLPDVPKPGEPLREVQREWDDAICHHLKEGLLERADQEGRARILAAASTGAGAWLDAVPSSSFGTLLDREALRIGVGLRVGADLCQPHSCRCGGIVDKKGLHTLSCRFSAGRSARHAAINDVVKRALVGCGFPSSLEPTGINRGDGKRPDGMTLFPWRNGRCLVWDATVVDTFADTHLAACSLEAGAGAGVAEERKRGKYANIAETHIFEPIAFETMGSGGPTTLKLLKEIGRGLIRESGDSREASWFRQRLAVAIIRGNAASVRGSLPT